MVCGADLLKSFTAPGVWAAEDVPIILSEGSFVPVTIHQAIAARAMAMYARAAHRRKALAQAVIFEYRHAYTRAIDHAVGDGRSQKKNKKSSNGGRRGG